jgi:hypothetical protein
MNRPAPQTPRHGKGPRYWMNEQSGRLEPVIWAFLERGPMSDADIATMRAYLRQWIDAPQWVGPEIANLRQRVDGLTSREAIDRWLDDALKKGIDPL